MRRFSITLLLIFFAWSLRAAQPSQGYRGFLEWGNDLYGQKVVDWKNPGKVVHATPWYTGVTTSHGYQINPTYFVGLGLGLEHCSYYDRWMLPVFLQGRADFQFGKFTPFADLRAGLNLGCGVGAYFSPTVGYRFNWGRKMGVNIGLGMSVLGYSTDVYDFVLDPMGYMTAVKVSTEHRHTPTFTFRVGIDF